MSTAASHGPGSDSTYGPMFVAPTVEELNESLPQFEFVELLGQGGMGAVYKARQPRLDRFVAIKLLPAFAGVDEHNFAERFEREARAMAKMNHPNIVTVHDFGETAAGHRYIVMEYVDGYDLHHTIQSGELTSKHALAWIPLICKALDYAHEHGLVHRDIKPANILISKEGEVKVGDFGLAKLVGRKHETSITRTQVSMGTPDYAAPEALEEGGIVDRRADIYSLGVLFYELLTGKVPRGAWKPPSAYSDVDVRLDQIIIKAMQPDPEHRYQTVAQLTSSLSDVRKSPKMVVSSAGSKQLLTGTVNVPSQKELDNLKGSGASSSKTTARKKKGAHPVVVAGIAIGGVLLAVGVILLLMMKLDANAKATAKIPPTPKPPPVVTPGDPEKKDPVVVDTTKAKSKPKPPTRPKVVEPPKRSQFSVLDPPRPVDGWVDLMEGLVTRHPGVEGTWVRGANGVVKAEGDFSKSDPSRIPFAVPAPVKGSYELKAKISPLGPRRMFGFLLPVGSSNAFFTINASSRTDKTSYCGLSMIDGFQSGHPQNPTRAPINLESGRVYDLELQVVSNGTRVGVYGAIDSKQILRWEGTASQLRPPPEARATSRRLITVVSLSPMSFAAAQMRASGPEATLAGKATVPATPIPQSMKSPELAQKLAELQEVARKRVESEADAPFKELLVSQLHTGYEAALGRLIETAERSRDLLTKASALREVDRIKALRPIEPDDPPEMPQAVKDARALYRVEIGKLEAQRDLLLLPILRDQLASIEALEAQFASLGDAGMAQIEKAANPLRGQIRKIESGIPSSIEEPSEPAMDPPSAEGVGMPETGTRLLERVSFPPSRSMDKGEVVAWGRKPGMAEVDLGDVPAGLATTAVAIDGMGDLAVALKSNGKLEVWGKSDLVVPEEITDMSSIVDMAVSYNERYFHFVGLSESGKIQIFADGWASDLADAQAKVEMFERVVDVAVSPRNGMALLDDGSLEYWGRFPEASANGLPDKVAKLEVGPEIVAAICEDYSIHVYGAGKPSFPPNLTEAKDLAFGHQELMGGVAILPDGKALTFGSFAGFQNDLSQLVETQTLVRVVGGVGAFAVQ
ncbi:MAG: serine/threonine-protein kinase, partial [Verrucomicrobiota bacterium]